MCTIIEGEKKVKINDEEEITYKKDKFIILPPYSDVNMVINESTKALVFELSDDLISNVRDKLNCEFGAGVVEKRPEVFLGKRSGELLNSVNRIVQASSTEDNGREFLIDLYAQEMTYNLLKVKGIDNILRGKVEVNKLSSVLDYIHNNLHKNIQVSDLAKSMNMSVSGFASYFKKSLGVSTKMYIKEKKLSRALEMLKDMNVTEVSLELGFENISYFIKIFKDKYGVTPKQYKTLNLSIEA